MVRCLVAKIDGFLHHVLQAFYRIVDAARYGMRGRHLHPSDDCRRCARHEVLSIRHSERVRRVLSLEVIRHWRKTVGALTYITEMVFVDIFVVAWHN